MNILDDFKSTDKNEFRKDFLQLIRVAYGIDKYYGKAHKSVDKYLPKYKLFIEAFNKKYKNLKLKLSKDIEKLKLGIFIKEKNLKDVFSNVASKIEGLKDIGAENFNVAGVENSEKFAKELMNVKNQIYISYGEGDIHLEFNEKEKIVELHYDYEEISDEKNPGFKLLSYYALKDGYDNSIKIYEKGSEFGFSDLLTETEKNKWLDKFDPKLEE